MTILLLTHSYPDAELNWRGKFVQDQALAIGREHEVIVVYSRVDYLQLKPFSGYSFTQKPNGNITEYYLTIFRSFPVVNQIKYFCDTFRFIRNQIMRRHRIDIIHCHFSYPAGFFGTIIGKFTRIPCVLTEHTWIKKYFRSMVHRLSVIYTLNHASTLIAVSSALKSDINTYCNRRVIVVPNVIETGNFRLSEKEKKDKRFSIGILGGMGNYRKGLDILISAVSLLKDMDLVVHIGGEGILLDTFKKHAEEKGVEDRCIFYGEIRPEKAADFYSMLDIYTLPSRDETFGVVVLEAMACGLPVIATRCGGPEEIITKETGILIGKEDPEELAAAIRSLGRNIGKYNRHLIRNYVLEKYSQKSFVQSISTVYQELLRNTK